MGRTPMGRELWTAILATFKDYAPLHATSHGGDALVVCGYNSQGSPGVKPAAFSSIHIYARDFWIIYDISHGLWF